MTLNEILVPLDFSEDSDAALDYAIELAARFRARLRLVHAYNLQAQLAFPYEVPIPAELWRSVRDAAAQKLDRAREKAESAGVGADVHLSECGPASAIAELAEQLGVDLVVMGTRGRTGVGRLLLGSVAERTIRMAPCPVLTLKARG